MATSKEFLNYVQDQCAGLEVSFRAMMGEYVLYCGDRVAGGLYDNRVMIKPVPAAFALLPQAALQEPYPGAKQLLVLDCMDDRDLLRRLFEAIYPELPAPKRRKKA